MLLDGDKKTRGVKGLAANIKMTLIKGFAISNTETVNGNQAGESSPLSLQCWWCREYLYTTLNIASMRVIHYYHMADWCLLL